MVEADGVSGKRDSSSAETTGPRSRFWVAPVYPRSSLVGCVACVFLGVLGPGVGLTGGVAFYLCAAVWMVRYLLLTWLPYVEIEPGGVTVRNGWLEGNRWFPLSEVAGVEADIHGNGVLTILLHDRSRVRIYVKRARREEREELEKAVSDIVPGTL